MNWQPYAEVDPEVIRRKVDAAVATKTIGSLIVPLLITASDKKMLIVGNLPESRLKLPDTSLDIVRHPYPRVDALRNEIAEFCRFAFVSCPPPSYVYSGLIRFKLEERRVIAPAVVSMPIQSSDEKLQRSEEWLEHTRNNADHIWMDNDELKHMREETTLVTKNTATIIEHFTSQL